MASGSNAPFSGEFVDLENVPQLPEGISADQVLEQNADAIRQAAESRHAAGLSQVEADGGFFDAFVNSSKVASKSNLKISTDTNGLVKLGIAGIFDLSTASFTQSISAQDDEPRGVVFNNDGTKLFEIGGIGEKIYESSLSTPFDISTASFTRSISGQDGDPQGLTFNDDGTKLFEVGGFGFIYEFSLSTPFDISTANFTQDINSRDSIPSDVAFNNDGTKLFEVGNAGAEINEFSLSTPFDISTASFTQSVNTQDGAPEGLAFNNDGTKFFVMGGNQEKVFESSLSTPFDISTASFTRSKNAQPAGRPRGVLFNNDGTKLIESGSQNSEIYESSLGSGLNSSGTVTEQQFTFTDTQGNAFSPSKVGIFPDQTLNGQSITYDLKDSTGTVVETFNQSDLNQLQSVNTTDTTFQVEANLSGNGSQTPELEFLDVRGV